MKTYNATFETSTEVVSVAKFNANSLKEAKELAQRHKHLTPEINRHKNVKTNVRLAR